MKILWNFDNWLKKYHIFLQKLFLIAVLVSVCVAKPQPCQSGIIPVPQSGCGDQPIPIKNVAGLPIGNQGNTQDSSG